MPKSVNAMTLSSHAGAVDPDQAVLLIHFIRDVPQPVLVLAEHFGDAGDGADMMASS